ncbi:hypothetical protein IJX73_02800 [bacterium]|nr:hypothetical protein [bacterium]
MENKKTIVNDVDVSGCKYFVNLKTDCLLIPLRPDVCKNNPDCYYKEYMRKKQECKELQEQQIILDDEAVVVEITVEQFEEYKKLRQALHEIKEIVLSTLDCGEWIGQGDNKMEKICTIIKELKDE